VGWHGTCSVHKRSPNPSETRLEDLIVEHIFKRHITLRPIVTTKPLKSPEQRVLGDSRDWNEVGTETHQVGDEPWRSGLPLDPAPFLQAMNQWKLEGTTPKGPLPGPLGDPELRSQDPTGP